MPRVLASSSTLRAKVTKPEGGVSTLRLIDDEGLEAISPDV
jgi:hypothetical protein